MASMRIESLSASQRWWGDCIAQDKGMLVVGSAGTPKDWTGRRAEEGGSREIGYLVDLCGWFRQTIWHKRRIQNLVISTSSAL